MNARIAAFSGLGMLGGSFGGLGGVSLVCRFWLFFNRNEESIGDERHVPQVFAGFIDLLSHVMNSLFLHSLHLLNGCVVRTRPGVSGYYSIPWSPVFYEAESLDDSWVFTFSCFPPDPSARPALLMIVKATATEFIWLS
jgi:hypothetical protein